MGRKIIIWGTGKYGNMAYHFYNGKCDIQFFVDSDRNKWEKKLYGLPIRNPDILFEEHFDVVVALKSGLEDVQERLKNEFGYKSIEIFQLNNYLTTLENDLSKQISKQLCKNMFIIHFGGGLGNQMFQYALAKALEVKGKKVWANTQYTKYNGTPDFILSTIFEKIDIVECDNNHDMELIKSNSILGEEEKFILYREAKNCETKKKTAYHELLNMSGGIIQGWMQTCYFAELAKEELYEEYTFNRNSEEKLRKMCEFFDSGNYVSVHFRRGDYLEERISVSYENICTDKYYKTAIDYIRQQFNDDVRFCFFSNDIDWVKKNYKYPDALYIESNMFKKYEDWYDMCLMSHCKHNIIANSTFSWWGAWLNRNPQKIVIAPRKWVNQCDYLDIYPDEWIKM